MSVDTKTMRTRINLLRETKEPPLRSALIKDLGLLFSESGPALLDAADRLTELEAENGRLLTLLSDVTCVAITMLYDGHKQDVLNTFTVPELTDVVARTEHLQPERVEHIYRRGYDALAAGGDA